MSNNIIPKEQLTAYQRWELAAFDEEARLKADTAPAAAEPAPPVPAVVDEVSAPAPEEVAEAASLPYPTAEEIEAIHQQAYQEAFGEGQKAGFEQGFEQGLNEGRLTGKQEVERLAQAIGALDEARTSFEHGVSDDLLQLALEVARQVVRVSVRAKPERMLPVIQEAVASLPNLANPPQVFLNPADLAAVEGLLGHEIQQGWRLRPDDAVEQGGCRIETQSSEVDASLATRWKRVVAALGSNGDWID
ncbi:flagellar assembly protein FliH [Chitinivorax sp. PXF-14]|uniref:flagellar assembly protein FliH n=1 Tax=Chitinivorax sp. PXF-14 TaxID=3230488 RepID=UPI003467A070